MKRWQDVVAKKMARKAKRKVKALEIAKQKCLPIRRAVSRSTLKKQIIRLLGLLAAKKNGKQCQMGAECPNKAPHLGTLSYHIVPAQRGDFIRFFPANVIWACVAANYGEVRNRSLYQDVKHVNVFGREFIETLKLLARNVVHYSTAELWEMRERLKKELES